MSTPLVSVILRSKNEERWIGACLEAIYSQSFKDFEVILVDNNSTDKTVEKAQKYPVKILNIDNFFPGRALNLGISNSRGKYFVCLSAHCIPTNKEWLAHYLDCFKQGDERLAAVYGRQEPMSFTTATDKRDLLTIFGLDPKIQWKDSFFHNANSMIRRDLWDAVPFDEETTNIEDRLWARQIQKRGHCIAYDPRPSVYHWHGIHQNQNEERCSNVVKIIEGLNRQDGINHASLQADKLNIVALIPIRGPVHYLNGRPLLEYTIEAAKNAKSINKVVVLTDSHEHAEMATKAGAEVPFLRGEETTSEYVDLSQVYQSCLVKMEEMGLIPDVVVALEPTFPLRPKEMIDHLVERFLKEGVDSLVPVKLEYAPTWKRSEQSLTPVDQTLTPRQFKDPLFIAVKGLGFVTYPNYLRQGEFFGSNVGVFEIKDPKALIEVRDELGLELASRILQ